MATDANRPINNDNPPAGTVTFLFTDIEGSTRLWESAPGQMAIALARHDRLLRDAFGSHGGYVFKTIGDAFCVAFENANDACLGAIAAQRSLTGEEWPAQSPIRVRMGIHTGTVDPTDGDYFGNPVNRTARLMSVAHGGQIVVSGATQALLSASVSPPLSLKDLATHRLKDLLQPEHVYQVCHSDLPVEFPPLRSLQQFANNLPVEVTSFVGREQELADIKECLLRSRLTTLIGTGGCGKTRIAMHAAADVLERYSDGVWLVELAPLYSGDQIVETVANVLSLREEPGRSVIETVTGYLADRSVLLILDNCEHLIDAAARFGEHLLKGCARLSILATSRERMGIAGEATYRVPSLTAPDPGESVPLSQLVQFDAIRLFSERAKSVSPTFAVNETNALAVASVCHRLDGIPLAIELASVRVRVLSPQRIAEHLDDRFRILTGGSRTALPRQQTLRALIDWSYGLLSDKEKTVLQRLCVFTGGWTLAASEAVCSGEDIEDWEVLDLLSSLVDKSLVTSEIHGQDTRHRMLETITHYALERLREAGAEDAVRNRHLSYFIDFAEEAMGQLEGRDILEWLNKVQAELDNIRSAVIFADRIGAYLEELRMSSALWSYWFSRGPYAEGRRLIEMGLDRCTDTAPEPLLCRAFSGAGNLASISGDFTEARSYHEASLAIHRRLGDKLQVAITLNNIGFVAFCMGDSEYAKSVSLESLSITREQNKPNFMANSLDILGCIARDEADYEKAKQFTGEALSLLTELHDLRGVMAVANNHGMVLKSLGEYSAARDSFERCLSVSRELGDQQGIAYSLINLASLSQIENDFATAHQLFVSSLAILKDIANRNGISNGLFKMVGLSIQEAQYAKAAVLMGAVDTLRQQLKTRLMQVEQEESNGWSAQLKSILSEAVYDELCNRGRGMSWEVATDYALEEAR